MKKVLLCDDQKMLRKVLKESILQLRDDVTILEAENGAAGLDVISKEELDLVFLDVEMPTMDGFQALEQLRANEMQAGSRVPVVMVTAMNTNEDIVRGWELDADGYISKPYDLDEIAEALQNHLGVSSKPS